MQFLAKSFIPIVLIALPGTRHRSCLLRPRRERCPARWSRRARPTREAKKQAAQQQKADAEYRKCWAKGTCVPTVRLYGAPTSDPRVCFVGVKATGFTPGSGLLVAGETMLGDYDWVTFDIGPDGRGSLEWFPWPNGANVEVGYWVQWQPYPLPSPVRC